MPFEVADVVPLGFKSTALDDYTIHLSAFDGLFDFQSIYLKDRYLNIIHDLKAGDYYFRSNAGTFNDRFQIVYSTALLNTSDLEYSNSVILYHQNDKITIHSQTEWIDRINVYDVRGILLATQKEINQQEISFDLAIPDQVVLFEIWTNDGKKIVRKYVK